MSNILALDLSTKASGWSTKVNGELESGVITNSSTIIEKRIAYMRDQVLDLIKKYDIDTIVVEEVHAEYTHNSQVNQKLNWLQGCIRVAVWEYNSKIKIITILPNSWRAKIGIHTGRGITRDILKQKDIEYVQQKYGFTCGDDQADSIGILDSYLLGANDIMVPKKTKLPPIGSDESAF